MDFKKFYSDNMWIFVVIIVLILLFLFYRYCWEKKSLESDLSFKNVETRVTNLETSLGFHTQQQAQLQAQQQALQQQQSRTGTNKYGEQCNCDTQGNMNQTGGSGQQYSTRGYNNDNRQSASSSYDQNVGGQLNDY